MDGDGPLGLDDDGSLGLSTGVQAVLMSLEIPEL